MIKRFDDMSYMVTCDDPECSADSDCARVFVTANSINEAKKKIKKIGWCITDEGKTICPSCG